MPNRAWEKALATCADPARARRFWEQLRQTRAGPILRGASSERAGPLAALLGGSQALSEMLVAHAEWVAEALEPDYVKHPRREQGLRREIEAWLQPLLDAGDFEGAFQRLRRFKQRELVRIAVRDLARLGPVSEITRELSDVADACLDAVYRLTHARLTRRFGFPFHLDPASRWEPTAFCVLGLGKLGGRELNYSSDVDVMFVYTAEGQTFRAAPRPSRQPPGGLGNHQFFTRLAEAFVAEVGRMTADGFLYRIDLRLRPEGSAGPLVRALESYETYYAQWGQTWERLMLIKARAVAGEAPLAAEFQETIQSFRYPRSLGERALRDITTMKQRIETEVVKAGEAERNVKLGQGGIREVEFIVQTLQLLHAGRFPFLQAASTLSALAKLAQYQVLPAADVRALSGAYGFLREVEHRLQMENNLQTHTIPLDRKARLRLARLMGFRQARKFVTALKAHTGKVRRIYRQLLRPAAPVGAPPFPTEFAGEESRWRQLLAEHGFRDTDHARRLVEGFILGPDYAHSSPRTVELARELLAKFLAVCPRAEGNGQRAESKEELDSVGYRRLAIGDQSAPRAPSPAVRERLLSDPDRVLARLDSFIRAYGARAVLLETWTDNPSLFELLLLLFDRSEFLAETAIRTPDLVDGLVQGGQLRRRKSAAEILGDLRRGEGDADQRLWLRRFHEAEFMRIGLRDILGLADFEQHQLEFSALADACLQYALEVVWRQTRTTSTPFVIIGLGKLGGAELDYGSDLDIVFVADPKVRNLPRLQPVAARVMDLLSRPTQLGIAFNTDARLRPDGAKGLLVNTLDAYESYYRRRAALWEIQALTRARPVAGNPGLGERFRRLAARLTNFREPSVLLAAYRPDWPAAIARMRERIEKERTPRGREHLAIKTGPGGLVDAEFIAQTLCLANGWLEPNTLRALQRARDERALPPRDAELLIEHYRWLRRIEGILRRWSFEGETILPEDPAALYRVAVRCGYSDADAFMRAVADHRDRVRRVYAAFFHAERAK